MTGLRPFWRYYGGKWRAAPRYPKPQYGTIVEPFAGAAGYSLRYPELKVVLCERYPVVAGIWRYLIGASSAEILRIPYVEHVDELPAWVPQEARWLVGFCMNAAVVSPRRQLSAGRKRMRAAGCKFEGWSDAQRSRVAEQVPKIKHWRILEGSYAQLSNGRATWFIDPPYANRAGSYYVHSAVDYPHLAEWSRQRQGQVIVCENEGATWLPFRPFGTFKKGISRNGLTAGSREVIWTGVAPEEK